MDQLSWNMHYEKLLNWVMIVMLVLMEKMIYLADFLKNLGSKRLARYTSSQQNIFGVIATNNIFIDKIWI